MSAQYCVYILLCADGRFYVGSTRDLPCRVRRHNEGSGSVFTSARRPVTLAYVEQLPNRETALLRERQIKKWSRDKKLALIRRDQKALHDLSRRRRR
jgi:predicted GIY-YIG superfamily endonuclease